MSLTQEEINKIAKGLNKLPKQTENSGDSYNNILKYFELLQGVDTTGVEPTYSVSDNDNILREDIVKNSSPKEIKDLLACSPQKVIGNQIAISNIMK